MIAGLKAAGVSVIFISHRLNELTECADRVVVLRDGRVVGELGKDEITPRRHDPADDRPRPEIALCAAGRQTGCGRAEYRGRAHRGLSGAVGKPQREARRNPGPCRTGRRGAHRTGARHLWHRPACSPDPFRSTAKQFAIANPREAIAQGIFLVPEDRKRCGLLLDVSIAENIALPNMRPVPQVAW